MNNKLDDQSSDRSYFVITPQLVWALCQDPYEYTLWGVIKMIAGEQGECMLSTPDLAAAAMMSSGKVSSCRQRLLDVGLLTGQMRRDPGYPQPVWHLTIPDLWAANVQWREANQDLLARIEGKRQQRESLHQVKAIEELSPGERGTTPGERGTTPGETKKNHDRTSIEQTAAVAAVPVGEDLESIDWHSGNGGHKSKKEVPKYKQTGDVVVDIVAASDLSKRRDIPDWAMDTVGPHPFFPVVQEFCKMTGQQARDIKPKSGAGLLKRLLAAAEDGNVTAALMVRAHGILPQEGWGQWHLTNHAWITGYEDSYLNKLVLAAQQIRDEAIEPAGTIKIRNR